LAVDQRELVERAGQGDHDAFAELARASAARLEALARLTLRDSGLAQDAVQETLVRAWRNLPGLRDPDKFDAWLHSLTIHSCIDVMRRRRRRPIEVDISLHNPATGGDWIGQIADRDQLERGFRRLTVEQRAVLVLHYYLGMSHTGVADALGVPIGTAQSRLHRALEAMRAALVAEGLPPADIRARQTA
jgi:RNA polymerase sigma-70 factor (ECF subfamily)